MKQFVLILSFLVFSSFSFGSQTRANNTTINSHGNGSISVNLYNSYSGFLDEDRTMDLGTTGNWLLIYTNSTPSTSGQVYAGRIYEYTIPGTNPRTSYGGYLDVDATVFADLQPYYRIRSGSYYGPWLETPSGQVCESNVTFNAVNNTDVQQSITLDIDGFEQTTSVIPPFSASQVSLTTDMIGTLGVSGTSSIYHATEEGYIKYNSIDCGDDLDLGDIGLGNPDDIKFNNIYITVDNCSDSSRRIFLQGSNGISYVDQMVPANADKYVISKTLPSSGSLYWTDVSILQVPGESHNVRAFNRSSADGEDNWGWYVDFECTDDIASSTTTAGEGTPNSVVVGDSDGAQYVDPIDPPSDGSSNYVAPSSAPEGQFNSPSLSSGTSVASKSKYTGSSAVEKAEESSESSDSSDISISSEVLSTGMGHDSDGNLRGLGFFFKGLTDEALAMAPDYNEKATELTESLTGEGTVEFASAPNSGVNYDEWVHTFSVNNNDYTLNFWPGQTIFGIDLDTIWSLIRNIIIAVISVLYLIYIYETSLNFSTDVFKFQQFNGPDVGGGGKILGTGFSIKGLVGITTVIAVYIPVFLIVFGGTLVTLKAFTTISGMSIFSAASGLAAPIENFANNSQVTNMAYDLFMLFTPLDHMLLVLSNFIAFQIARGICVFLVGTLIKTLPSD